MVITAAAVSVTRMALEKCYSHQLCIVVCQQVYCNVACQLVIEIMPTCIVWCCMWAINSEFKPVN